MRMMLIAILTCVLFGPTLCRPVMCQEVQAPDEFDFDRLAKIPTRFNGRLATLEEVAKNYAQRFGGTTQFVDTDGTRYPALDWYLLMISESERLQKIQFFHVSEDCQELLGIPESENQLYCLDQLGTKEVLERVDAESERIREIEYEDLSPVDRKLLLLDDKFRKINQLILSHQSPWLLPQDQLVQEIKLMDFYASLDVPRMVFPEDSESGRWQVLYKAAFTERVAELVEEEGLIKNHYAKYWIELLTAIKDSDAKVFKQRLEQLEMILAERQLGTTALRFAPPQNWIEEGKSNPYAQSNYEDAFTTGVPMSMMLLGGMDSETSITINHFPGKKIDPYLLCNSWRYSEGLSLLTKQEFDASIPRNEQNGKTIWNVDVTTPESVPKKPRRIVATIIDHPSGTWTSSVYGDPETVENQLDAFRNYVDSIVIPDEVGKWVAADQAEEFDDTVIHAIIKRGESVDFVIKVMGDSESVSKLKDDVMAVVRSIKEVDSAANASSLKEVTDWTAPESWDEYPKGKGHERVFFLADQENMASVAVMISAVKSMNPERIGLLVNHLRASIGQEPLSEAELNEKLPLDGNPQLIEIGIQ